MRKLTYAFALLAVWLLGAQSSVAETVTPYKQDFNETISTSSHDFQVASGWGHVVSSYLDADEFETVYPKYTYYASSGFEDTGCLYVDTQTQLTAASWGTGSGQTTDLLVTPVVNGTASIRVKKYTNSSKSGIKFYAVTENADGTFDVGSEIPLNEFTFDATSFIYVSTASEVTNTRIGIWASKVYIDDFQASSAEIVPEKKMKLTAAKLLSNDYPKCDVNNKFEVKYSVTLQNTGDLDIAVGDEGYSVSLYLNSGGTVIETTNISKPLAKGATVTDTISVTVPYTSSARVRYDVKENMKLTNTYLAWIEPTPYLPILELRNSDGKVDSLSTHSWGMINASASKNFTLRNKGGKALNITGIALPEGYSCNITTPYVVAAGADSTLTVTLNAEQAGIYDGQLVITGDEISRYAINLSGTVLDPTKWYVTFEDQKAPAGTIVEDNWAIAQIGYASSDNAYALQHKVADSENKFISPLLEVAEGETMTFEVGRVSRYGSYGGTMNVYYSTDRTNWTKVKSITRDELSTTTGSYGSFCKPTSFTLEGVPAGKYYIAFGGSYVFIDNIYGFTPVSVAHDLLVSASKLPATGMVNRAYTATAKLKNINTKAEEAGSYTATLYVNGEAVATAEAVTLDANSEKEYTFTYTPHAAGTFPAYVEFAANDGFKLASTTSSVAIAEESASADYQVGEYYSAAASMKAPISPNWKHSASDAIYTAESLAAVGLKAGDKISKIYYKGYNDKAELTIEELKSWIANTEEETFSSSYSAFPNTDEMTSIYNSSYTIPLAGSTSEHVAMLEFPLAEPFVYDGHALRIFTQHDATDYKNISLDYVNDDKTHAYGGHNDYNAITASSMSKTVLPVLYLSVVRESPVLSGTVTDEAGDTLAGATVTLTSGDVIYSATTDSVGAYAISVIQTDKEYVRTVEAPYHETHTDNITVTENTVSNVELECSVATLSGTITDELGDTLVNASVTLTSLDDAQQTTVTTNEQGAYSFTLFASAEQYQLAVTAPYHEDYADTLAVEQTTVFDVELGCTVVTLSGTVTDELGDTLVNASVTLTSLDDADQTTVTTSEQGAYTFTLLASAEQYQIAVSAPYHENYTDTLAVEQTTVFDVELGCNTGTIQGTVLDGTTPVAGAVVVVTSSNPDDMDYTLETTGEDGKFSYTYYSGDHTYTITVSAAGYEKYVSEALAAVDDTTTLSVDLTRVAATVSVPATGWTTYSSLFDIDFTQTAALEVYKVTGYAEGKATIERIEGIVPAETGVLLHATAGDYDLTYATEAGQAVSSNLLAATAGEALSVVAENYGTVYALTTQNGESGFGLAAQGDTVAQGAAYLPVTTTGADTFYALYDPASGIGTAVVSGSRLDKTQPMYNLSGQRVGKNYKGVVLQNGQKFVVK